MRKRVLGFLPWKYASTKMPMRHSLVGTFQVYEPQLLHQGFPTL